MRKQSFRNNARKITVLPCPTSLLALSLVTKPLLYSTNLSLPAKQLAWPIHSPLSEMRSNRSIWVATDYLDNNLHTSWEGWLKFSKIAFKALFMVVEMTSPEKHAKQSEIATWARRLPTHFKNSSLLMLTFVSKRLSMICWAASMLILSSKAYHLQGPILIQGLYKSWPEFFHKGNPIWSMSILVGTKWAASRWSSSVSRLKLITISNR